MNPLGKIRMSITIDEDLLERVKSLASEDCRNTSSMINKILRDALQKSGHQENQ
jgi:metal-responsive CopG/Arc/MetJ family transcriptional regulator